MNLNHTDEAVSPVVGVMLMLVVTIILAAIVSAFAGGIWTAKEETLQVSLVARTPDTSTIYFDHMGGDGFNLDDIIFVLDQGDSSLRFTNDTLSCSGCGLFNKAGQEYIRPGDIIVLKGTPGTDSTTFTAGTSIDIDYNKEFTWTILHKRTDSILSRGTLVLTK
jgi:flagellin-like protein